MSKKVRLQDIADSAGVSITTVSHVINRTRNVDDGTRDKVLVAIRELGYQVPSKRKVPKRSMTIGLIIADIRVDFFSDIIREIEGLAAEDGYNVVVMDSEENPEKELYCIRKLIAENVSGIILSPSNTGADFGFCRDFPIVQIDRMVDSSEFDFVGTDNMSAIYDLTLRMLGKGCRNIGFLCFSETNYCARERVKGYQLAMVEKECYRPEHTLFVDYEAGGAQEDLNVFLDAHPELDSIICTSSNICYELIAELRRGEYRNIRYVCTFDNNKWLDYMDRRVDSIAQPITDIAANAVALLKARIDGKVSGRKKILLDCSFIGRSDLFC